MPNHYLLTLKSLLRRLDYLPSWLAIALGVCLSLSMVLIPASPLVTIMGFVMLLGIAVALAMAESR